MNGFVIRCVVCRTRYDKHFLSSRKLSEKCTINTLKEKEAEIEMLRSRLTFLCPQFDTDSVDGVQKGDVVIVVQGRADEPLSAHKFILSNRSSVFCKMFDIKMIEEDTGMVCIDDTTLPIMRAVIKFCYDAEIKFTNEVTAEKVLEVAHKYDIAFLQTTCEAHLIPTITNANLAYMLKLAKKFQATVLQEAAWQHFKSNFDNVNCDVMDQYASLSLE